MIGNAFTTGFATEHEGKVAGRQFKGPTHQAGIHHAQIAKGGPEELGLDPINGLLSVEARQGEVIVEGQISAGRVREERQEPTLGIFDVVQTVGREQWLHGFVQKGTDATALDEGGSLRLQVGEG